MTRFAALLALACAAGCSSLPRYGVDLVGEGVDTARLQQLYAEYQRPILILDGRLYVPDGRCCGAAGPQLPVAAAPTPSAGLAPPPGAVGLALDDRIDEPAAEPTLGDLRCVLAEDGSHFDLEGLLEPEQQLNFWDGERLRRADGFSVPLR